MTKTSRNHCSMLNTSSGEMRGKLKSSTTVMVEMAITFLRRRWESTQRTIETSSCKYKMMMFVSRTTVKHVFDRPLHVYDADNQPHLHSVPSTNLESTPNRLLAKFSWLALANEMPYDLRQHEWS